MTGSTQSWTQQHPAIKTLLPRPMGSEWVTHGCIQGTRVLGFFLMTFKNQGRGDALLWLVVR